MGVPRTKPVSRIDVGHPLKPGSRIMMPTFEPKYAGEWVVKEGLPSYGGAWGSVFPERATFLGAPHVHAANPELWEALTKWLEFHGFDSCDVPAETVIVRRNNYAATTCLARDEDGRVMVEQFPDGPGLVLYTRFEYNEGPPLPFPGFGFEDFADRLQF